MFGSRVLAFIFALFSVVYAEAEGCGPVSCHHGRKGRAGKEGPYGPPGLKGEPGQ